ncbi:MAG: pyrroloquinoline quinone-dependent dehydrogenase [Gemmatimonadota bacterium]|nr:pyrroloquinoline quinone-dependent dehydrogenase [Gemmatimonadota bacterium]
MNPSSWWGERVVAPVPAMARAALLAAVIAAGCGPSGAPGDGARPGEWPTYGGAPDGTKHSALASIDRGNVSGLEVAWTWATGDVPVSGPVRPIPGQEVRAGNFETTPLVLGDTMYLSTPFNRVVALNAATGEEYWSYDPGTAQWGRPPNGTGLVHRGVAVWNGPRGRRIFLNTRWRLIALDAATGIPVEEFGHRGEIDLTEHLLWPTNRLHYTQTSPPLVFEDLVIVGNGVWDGFVYPQDPPGNIQAFDVRTGEIVWNFNPIPQTGEFGNETWEDGSERVTGHTNAWAPMVADHRRGLLYVPMGTPSNDYYGGDRKGDNLFAETLLCLDARTGERVWHFQTVRHGLWDYDLPGGPVLYTAEVDGRSVDAVAVAGKTGFVYAFDRVTGEPVWPMEDAPVPPSDVPGERASPTQPIPTRPAPFARQGFTEEDLVSLTPELNRKARELTRGLRFGPLYTPPSMEGTLGLPGIIGGGNWGGAAVDPATAYLYVKSTESPALFKLAEADTSRVVAKWDIDRAARGLTRVDGIPIIDPPYGTVTAIDMNTGDIVWQEVVGDDPGVRGNPALAGVELPERLGVAGAPGPMVTAGGLVFVTGGGDVLYAFDAATGAVLWEGALPGRGYANPMTYATRDGRQFVAIATGGGTDGGTLVVFSLSEEQTP